MERQYYFGDDFTGAEYRVVIDLVGRKAHFVGLVFSVGIGRAPVTLEELVPKFLSAVPLDPFESSRPLSYDAERGVIWTIGPDGDYNGQMRTSKQIMLGSKYARRLDGRRIRSDEGEKGDLKR